MWSNKVAPEPQGSDSVDGSLAPRGTPPSPRNDFKGDGEVVNVTITRVELAPVEQCVAPEEGRSRPSSAGKRLKGSLPIPNKRSRPTSAASTNANGGSVIRNKSVSNQPVSSFSTQQTKTAVSFQTKRYEDASRPTSKTFCIDPAISHSENNIDDEDYESSTTNTSEEEEDSYISMSEPSKSMSVGDKKKVLPDPETLLVPEERNMWWKTRQNQAGRGVQLQDIFC
jgi:hypothetical protein